MKRKWLGAPVLVFWLTLEAICGVAGASSQVPYPEPPDWAVPYGCSLTGLGADGPQYGDTSVATITATAPTNPKFVAHIKVEVSQGYWLMQVRGPATLWDNPDGIHNTTYEGDDAGPGFGVVAVACPWPCLGSPPLPTTTTTLPEPYCEAPPTTLMVQVSTTTTSSSPTSVVITASTVTAPTTSAQAQVRAVVATPQFTG